MKKTIKQLAGQTTITASARLAQTLQRQVADYQQNLGVRVWQTPDILPWEAWLQRCWRQAEEGGFAGATRLISDVELQLLWQQLVEQDQPALLDIQQTSQRAVEAWRRLCNWQIDPQELGWGATHEVACFNRWAQNFRQLLTKNNWQELSGWAVQLTELPRLEQLATAWREQINSTGAETPDQTLRLCFAGFDQLTPLQGSLQAALEAVDVEVLVPQWPAPELNISAHPAVDGDQELLAAASWALRQLQANADQRLAVVVPNLQQQRSQVERLFDRVFHPRRLVAAEAVPQSTYAIAVGQPLSEYRLVADGLRVIELLGWKIPLEKISGALLSPFVLERSQIGRRSELDAQLRKLGKTSLALREIGFMLGEGRHRGVRKVDLPAVAEAVKQSLELLESLPRQALPSRWGRIFVDQQKIWNWPGDTPLDSALHQTLNAWHELISQFAGLDASVGELNLQQARSLIQRLARQRRFQPLNSDAGVQILATLEPWPGQFNAIRVVGLDDQQFPASASANPFLPLALQRRMKMPGSSPEQALDYARRQLAAWGIDGDQLSVSFAQTSNQGDHRGSPLIDWFDLKPEPAVVETPAQRLFAAAQQAPLVETYADSTGLPVVVGPEGPARGGAGLFQDQAECPFKAYLKRRLLTTVPEEPLPGLDAMAQGSLVHQVLEEFWQAVGSSEALQQLDNAQRGQQIALAVDAVIGAAAQQLGLESEPAQQLERGRLTRLLTHWLPRELERQPFTVVGFEQPLELQVGDLLVNGRADRIDQLDDGRQVVIDYKSGEVKRKQWFSEPLIAPQLPLYQLAIDDPAGVAFAQLKPGKQKFVDVGEGGFKPGGHPKDPDWQVVRQQWHGALTGLAADYLAGNAAVAPAEPGVCNYCEFELICRVGEGDLARQQEDAE